MHVYFTDDTIAAIATPSGEGAISIIRVSGAKAIEIVGSVFSGPIKTYKSHTAHVGKIFGCQKNIIDSVLVLVMKAPNSYTGEDIVEIFCHGGSFLTKKVLSRILEAGARAANPGEFTYRAFRNQKLDLTQAEAVQQLIAAKNDLAISASHKHLEGVLFQEIASFQNQLIDIAAIIEAWVDFPEEDLEFISKEELLSQLNTLLQKMKKLSSTFHEGKIVFEGLSLCIVGSPNVGKSSLMNALLKKDRAIVTPIAGTTRDLLEENLRLGSLHFRLIDTAGVRETEEIIEKEGIKRTKKAMEEADIILWVLDASKNLSKEDEFFYHHLEKEKTLCLWNKIDIKKPEEKLSFPYVLEVSAKYNQNLDAIREMLEKIIKTKIFSSKEELVISSLRHKEALDAAIDSLKAVIDGLKTNVSPEFISLDIQLCLKELNTMIGKDVSEEVLSAIFSKFCIGK